MPRGGGRLGGKLEALGPTGPAVNGLRPGFTYARSILDNCPGISIERDSRAAPERSRKYKSRKPNQVHGLENEGAGTRTLDLRIKSPLLYQLSYAFYDL